VVAVAFAARLYRLGEESLWIDEAISFGRSRLSWPELLADSIARKHVPTYFVVLKAWLTFGDSEAMMRFPSVVFSTVVALLTYATGVLLHGRLAGVVAGLLVALASMQVHYGQEARMYALLSVATSTALLALTWLSLHPQAATAPPWRRVRAQAGVPSDPGSSAQDDPLPPIGRGAVAAWLGVALGSTLALYSHNTAFFFVAALNAAAAVIWVASPGARMPFARNWFLCMGVVLALWAIWLPTLLSQSGDMRETWRGREPNWPWVRGVLIDLYAFGDRSGATALLLVVLVGVAAHTLRQRRRLFWSTLAFAGVGACAALAVSQVIPMFYRRLLIWESPAWFLLVGVGVAALPRALAALIGVLLASLVVPNLVSYYARETKPGWRPLIQMLSDETDGSSLILSARAERFLDYYYGRHSDPLPARTYQRAKPQRLERQIGDAPEFFLIGQNREADYQRVVAKLKRMQRYKAIWTKRSQNAVLSKYRLRPGGKR
jgi:mannosyltransferase